MVSNLRSKYSTHDGWKYIFPRVEHKVSAESLDSPNNVDLSLRFSSAVWGPRLDPRETTKAFSYHPGNTNAGHFDICYCDFSSPSIRFRIRFEFILSKEKVNEVWQDTKHQLVSVPYQTAIEICKSVVAAYFVELDLRSLMARAQDAKEERKLFSFFGETRSLYFDEDWNQIIRKHESDLKELYLRNIVDILRYSTRIQSEERVAAFLKYRKIKFDSVTSDSIDSEFLALLAIHDEVLK